jgi:PAS domain S-box-containing protein/putative nucleotidyltransferase with HDIG domain
MSLLSEIKYVIIFRYRLSLLRFLGFNAPAGQQKHDGCIVINEKAIMINLLKPPIFDDEDKTLVAHHLFIIVWTFMAVGCLALLIAIIIPETVYRWLLVVGVIESAGLVLLALNICGYTRLVSHLLIFIIWAVATGEALTGGGTSSNAMAIYLIVVLIAGLVLSGKAGIIIAGLCSLTGFFLVILEYGGALPVNRVPHTPLTQWIANTIYMAVIISLQYLVSRTIRNALKQSRQELKERQRVDAALRESEERYRNLFENAKESIFVAQDGKLVFLNPRTAMIIGYSGEDLLSRSFVEFIHPDDRDMVIDRHVRRMKGEELPHIYSFRIIHRDGNIRWVDLNTVLINWEGNPATLNFLSDTTERKRAEEELLRSRQWLSLHAEQAPLAVVEFNLEGRVRGWNPAAGKIFGYPREEAIGQHWTFMVPESVRCSLEGVWQGLIAKRGGSRSTNKNITKGGRIIDCEWFNTPLVDQQGETIGVASLVMDVTDRKQAEEKLQETLESLRKAVGTTIQVMVSAVETRDPYTAGHQIRSADLARAIATEMGLPPEKIEGIRMAGSIHDIGKLSIPAEILSKPTKLSDIEFSLIKEHASKGFEMLKNVESPWPLAEIVRQHHERMDGSGYPRKLNGEEILIEARILSVADVVEAMASHRPYRAGLGIDAALAEIEKNRGIIYDSTAADACLRLFREKGFKLEGINY